MSSLLHSLVLFLAISAPVFSAPEYQNIYTQFIYYGFPVGIIPPKITGYTIGEYGGNYSISLEERCDLQLPYQPEAWLAYSTEMEGEIDPGLIKVFSGLEIFIVARGGGYSKLTEISSSKGVIRFKTEHGLSVAVPAVQINTSIPCKFGFPRVVSQALQSS